VVTPEPTLRRDAQLNQQRILAAAAAVVHRDGPHVPMAVVAAAAGVGIGTLYRRYPNREALLDALTRRSFRLVLDNARAAAAWPGTGLDALAHFFGLTIASRGELILPLHGGPDPVTGLVERGVRQAGEHDRRQAAGEIGLDLDQVTGDTDQADAEHTGVTHQNAARRCTTRGAPRRCGRTSTTSKRTFLARTPDWVSQ